MSSQRERQAFGAGLKTLFGDAIMLRQDGAELLRHGHALLGRILLDHAMKCLGEIKCETLHSD